MPWTPPTFTPAVVWQNKPNTNTPLSASDLNLEATTEAAYAAQVGTSLATYFEGGSSPSVPIGQVITGGNLGGARTIDLTSTPNKLVTFTGTLTANCTITIANRAAGCQVYLLITQDGTGGHTLSISDGATSSVVTVASTANALSTLLVTCPDSANIDVSVLGASGGLTQAAADARYALTGVIAAGNLGSAYTIDLANTPNKLLIFTGTLNANCTITFVNRAAGCQVYLLITQDGTGGRVLSVSDGTTTSALVVAGNAGALSTIFAACPDATNLDVSVLGASGAPASSDIYVSTYGAVGNNTADDTAAIQAAINALPQTGNTETSGGRIVFSPNKTYKITSPLVVDTLVGITLDGGSNSTHGGARILAAYPGGSSLTIISARSAKSFSITGGLCLAEQDGTYAGIALDLSTRPIDVNSSNTDRASLKRFRIDLAANAGSTATGILLANAQVCDIEDGWITGGRDGIVGLLVNTNFSNSHSISKTLFQNQNRIPIYNPGQSWVIGPRNVFEPLLGGGAGSLIMDASLSSTQEGLTYFANSHEDASTPGTWITLNGGNGASVQGNFFTTGNRCLAIGGAYDGLTITGNTVYSASTAAWDFGPSSPTNVLCAGNRYGPGTVTATTANAVGDGSLVLDSTTAGLNEIIFPGTTLIQRVASGAVQMFNVLQQVKTAPTYSSSITPGHNNGSWQVITVTNGTAFTINAPTNPPNVNRNAELTIEVLNSSGGAMGVITWDAIFKFAGLTWTNPANTKKRFARFEWNGTNWICTAIATADY